MNWDQIPTLNSLRAFSELAQVNSYTKAADRLNVTNAAVRQQVKALEAFLDVSLVHRQGRGVALTSEGLTLAQNLNSAFNMISRSIETLAESESSRPVQITTSPAFAVEWLMPKIAEFQQQHPEITLMLNPTAEVIEMKPGGIDVAVRYCHRDRLAKDVMSVLISDMVVIGTSTLIDVRKFDAPSALTEMPWLQELNTNEVSDWFARRGVKLERPLIVSQMPGNLIMQAVRRGDGISYTARAFFQEDIRAGRIQVLHSEPATGIYYLELNSGIQRPFVRKFLNWLEQNAETFTS